MEQSNTTTQVTDSNKPQSLQSFIQESLQRGLAHNTSELRALIEQHQAERTANTIRIGGTNNVQQ